MVPTTRRQLVAASLLSCAAPSLALAQAAWPSRPLTLIVGFGPGSTTDVAARIVAERLADVLGQRVVVENRPGAASRIAAETVARSPKDGYTLFVGTAANLIGDSLNPSSKTFSRDLIPIALIGSVPNLLVVPAPSGISDVAGLLARARAGSGEIAFGSPGIGTVPHLQGELLAQIAGVRMTHVPYTGSAQAVTDLLAGRIGMMFAPASTALEHVRAGSLRALAITAKERTPAAPEIPTVAEVGLTGLDTGIWYGLMAPTGTLPEIVERIAAATATAVGTDTVTASFRGQLIDPLSGGPAAFKAFLATEARKWDEVAERAGLTKK